MKIPDTVGVPEMVCVAVLKFRPVGVVGDHEICEVVAFARLNEMFSIVASKHTSWFADAVSRLNTAQASAVIGWSVWQLPSV